MLVAVLMNSHNLMRKFLLLVTSYIHIAYSIRLMYVVIICDLASKNGPSGRTKIDHFSNFID